MSNELDYLAHHGVEHMRWGVWNAETLARYARERGAAVKSKIQNKVQERKELKKAAKETGYNNRIKEYKNARKQALYSHNPEVVAKNAATLTDQELENKIKRLKLEKQVFDLVPPKTKSAGAKVAEEFADSLAKSFGTKLGPELARALGRKMGNPDEDKSKDKSKDKNESSSENASTSSSSNSDLTSAFQNTGSAIDMLRETRKAVKQAKKDAKKSASSNATNNSTEQSSDNGIAKQYNINLNLDFGSIATTTTSKGASEIQRYSDDIIDVKPVSASSEKQTKSIIKRFGKKK